jgi:hydrogenase maturation protease
MKVHFASRFTLTAPNSAGDQVVVGLGSPFLGDDSIGLQVVRSLTKLGNGAARLVESHAGGLLLLEELTGMRQAIIVDALLDDQRTPGEVVVAGVGADSCHVACGHDCSLPQALALGRAMGLALPDDDQIHLVAIVAEDVSTFTERLSPRVAAALPQACQVVQALLEGLFQLDEEVCA